MKVTTSSKLIALANPSVGFVENIRMAEEAVAGHTFANALVSCPPSRLSVKMSDLPALSVSGCGQGREQALNVMMMEAVERNSLVFAGTEELVKGRAGDISPQQWRCFLPFSNQQIASRGKVPINDAYWVGESLSNKTRIRFAEAVSLKDGSSCAIPAALVYLGYGVPDEPYYAIADSNGCAAAETREEAVFRALLELIERDAFAIWWFNQVPRPELDFSGDELISEIELALKSEGRTLWLVDSTHDLEVPVVAALTADQSGGRIYVGCAAGTSQAAAARKAALEVAGFWFWGRISDEPPSRRQWLAKGTLGEQRWLRSEESRPLSRNEAFRFGDVEKIISALDGVGISPVLIDLTRTYFEIPVVRVIAPGLRSHRPRFSPGRLYEVPVRLGWLERARNEKELFPYQCPL